MMKGFSGFPAGKLRLTLIPNLFFSELLPIIDNLPELKVTIYAFWRLTQKEGDVRYLHLTDFQSDPLFMQGLHSESDTANKLLQEALEMALARGTFLQVKTEGTEGEVALYFLNTEKGRTAVEGISQGKWRPNSYEDETITLLVERPNTFVLYEQNIGPLTPLIADELKDAEQTYSVHWIEEAVQLAVTNNVRKWRYIISILERWRQEGKHDGINQRDSKTTLKQQIPTELEDIIKR